MKNLENLKKAGQSPWLDFISKRIMDDGTLQALIGEGLSGLTSNPSIFDGSISKTGDYDEEIVRLSAEGAGDFETYDELTTGDIRRAADLFRECYDSTKGADGYVSLEINPELSKDLEATIKEGKRVHAKVGRPNLMLKVPATEECFEAIEEFTAAGINVNATLIFSCDQYVKTAKAYIRGIRRAKAAGLDTSKIHSVASVFISRLDTAVDKLLPESDELRGCAAVANATVIYDEYRKLFDGFADGNAQRPLWASTSAKNPAYSDVKYIEELICPGTVNTIPEKTLRAFMDHGKIGGMKYTADQARGVLSRLASRGISIDEICAKLLEDGIASFEKAFKSLLSSIRAKADSLRIGAIAIGSDHAGYQLKSAIAEWLAGEGFRVIDRGTDSPDTSVDYPDFGEAVALDVACGRAKRGIVVCGSGIGISIAANKVDGIRAALVHDENGAEMSRRHNDANVLALSGRPFTKELAEKSKGIVKVWLETEFEGGRHQNRIDKIAAIERRGK